MPSLANHQSNTLTKLLLIGDSKCLAGDTEVKVTRGRSIGKSKTLRQLYYSPQHRLHDPDLDTYLLCDLGGYVGLNLMEQIIFSGVKDTLRITTDWGSIRATPEHRFLCGDEWLTAAELKVGTVIRHWVPGPGKDFYPKRAIVYSVPYHPYGNQHNIGDYGNYKRISRARAVLEANMNNMTLDEFVYVLRNDEVSAAELQYIPVGWDVHHKNRDREDDILDNLEAKPESEHVQEHANIRLQTSKATSATMVKSIESGGRTDTYDIVMADPHNNFIANGFVVHNSGKTGSLVSLVEAGYHLRILDLDNLLDSLKYQIQKVCPDRLGDVEFRTLRDKWKGGALGAVIDGKPKAWIDSIKMLDNWKYTDDEGTAVDLGKPAEWGPDCILVVDSLSRLCDAAYDFHESIIPTGKSGEYDGRAVYGNAQRDVENLLGMITSKSMGTNVILIAHGIYMDLPDGTTKIFPQGVGQKLSPKIPQYWPSIVRYKNIRGKRSIQFKSDIMIDLANPRPDKLSEELPIETGLATFFSTLRPPPTQVTKPKAVTLVRKP